MFRDNPFKNRDSTNTSSVDKFFSFDEARLAYEKFAKFEMSAEKKTSTSNLHVNTIITDAIDSIAHAIEYTEQILEEEHPNLAG